MKNRLFALMACVLLSPSLVEARALNVQADLNGMAVRWTGDELPGAPDITPMQANDLYSGEKGARTLVEMMEKVAREHPEIPKPAIAKAFLYLNDHSSSLGNTDVVTIIDFNRPSNEKRMSIIRMADGSVESYLVAHGNKTGELYAERFSNQPKTHMSSLGLYVTAEKYVGENGRSMRLNGMESTNSNARSRSIVVHPAPYVSDAAASRGMIGRSWGCPAVDPQHSDKIIGQIHGGSVFLIYRSKS